MVAATSQYSGAAVAVPLLREPKNIVTDPELFARGARSHGRIQETPGDSEQLDSGEVASRTCTISHKLTLVKVTRNNLGHRSSSCLARYAFFSYTSAHL